MRFAKNNKVDLIRQYLWYCHLPQSGKVKVKVDVFAYAKDFSTLLEMTEERE
jgi:hypothetical protein